ncbi:MAG: CoA transferase subunit A [Streptosporangiales bacterium]|nr:CoA transferase subunit A [Streptosporangiales bacterium]
MSAAEAMALVRDGDHVALGGTCFSRTPMALVFELIRQRRTGLTVSRPLASQECELLMVAGAADRVITSWLAIGLRWGLSRVLREYVEGGHIEYEELSHLSLGMRYKAGAMGVPYLPTYTMLGSDLPAGTAAREAECPFTGDTLLLLPAINPDVALIHAHSVDRYGNARIDGSTHMDVDMARAASTVIVSAERIAEPEEIVAGAASTALPHFVVDAVVEAPYGSYPHDCHDRYEADYDHFTSYVDAIKAGGTAAVRDYLDRHVHSQRDFAGFLGLVGAERLAEREASARELSTR